MAYQFDGKEGAFIDGETAQRWIDNYQTAEPNGVKAEFFGKEKLQQLLTANAMGIRVYYSKDDNEGWRFILVAADRDGRNLGPVVGGGTGMLLEGGLPCPPYCPPQ